MKYIGNDDNLINHLHERNRHFESLPIAGVVYIQKGNLPFYLHRYPQFSFIEYAENHYDMIQKEISKSFGIQKLCEHMGITMKEVIAFGDDYNDVEMISDAGIGIAMGNAVDLLKQKADYVTDISERDGIMKACISYGLITS